MDATGTRFCCEEDAADTDDLRQEVSRFRALFISDLHLYSNGCNYNGINAFLKHKHFDYVYLVGDIVDLWHLNARKLSRHRDPGDSEEPAGAGDPEKSVNIIRRLLKRRQHDKTRLVYLPGNHDDFFRNFIGMDIFGVTIQEEALHVTARGKRLLVTHGDRFDAVVRYHKWLSVLGSRLYDCASLLNRGLNALSGLLRLRPWSLAAGVKARFDSRLSILGDYETQLLGAARRRGLDGVVCGHSHVPCLREEGGLLYANCGDWMEHDTALVECENGELRLLHGDRAPEAVSSPPAAACRN